MFSIGQKVETVNGMGVIEDIKVHGSELAYVIRHSKRADMLATRDIYAATEIEPVYEPRIGLADFFFQSDLTDERKRAIIRWVNTLPEDNYQMIRELIDERLCEEHYNMSEG